MQVKTLLLISHTQYLTIRVRDVVLRPLHFRVVSAGDATEVVSCDAGRRRES